MYMHAKSKVIHPYVKLLDVHNTFTSLEQVTRQEYRGEVVMLPL